MRRRAGLFGLVLLISVTGLAPLEAQPVTTAPVPVSLAAFGSARSTAVTLRKDEILRIRPAQPPHSAGAEERPPAIYIYDSERHLLAKNDEASSAPFEWTAPDGMTVHAVLYSNSPMTVEYVVEVQPSSGVRGFEAVAQQAVVPVLFATDRRLLGRRPPSFMNEPNAENALSFGECFVSVPRDHKMGELEGPNIWKLEFSSNSEKHWTIRSSELSTRDGFYDEVRRRAMRSDERDALVFVHGYNSTFEDAARRTAQLTYDLGFNGPSVLFSWPSHGSLASYTWDERNVELSADALRSLLVDLSQKAGVKRIHVIAHSMGNRALARALAKMRPDVPVREVALLAPDIDAELFRRLAQEFPSTIGPITLYASSRDGALAAARAVAGYARAGQVGDDIVIAPNIETIDASAVDTSLLGLGHQYYGDAREILADLFAFFRGTSAAKRFGLRPAQARGGTYWVFAP